MVALEIESGTSGSVARNSDHYCRRYRRMELLSMEAKRAYNYFQVDKASVPVPACPFQ
jgi:hypothetical protein